MSFAIAENNVPVFERSNARHDFYQTRLRKNATELAQLTSSLGRPALLESHNNAVKGAKGPCILRSLSNFDIGHSFLFDSLHNLYLGLYVSRILFKYLVGKFDFRNDFSDYGLVLSVRAMLGLFFLK